ncbi:SDR family NAD(P)-dependent oxidoreductase [Novosphingobium sp. JCM 18896]|uniref:SDR family NAD(P)-dependent oxidoreductase n=1 Tax=Novosphingobium sp. JCM 18896 TaxID=2989731 RepID=UPI002223A9C6|nr:SDR family oxidoreductase [Novosphingobium sp. JCM 18896]MCW1431218.1 SDR family oxidoreductase [Novosphingobium sp. JCM 18896]
MSGVSGRLAGKVAIVTGAGQGIGEAIAAGYAAAGAKVIITGRTQGKLDAVVARITEAGGTAIGIEALAGNREHARRTVNRAIAEWGRIDVLVNNAHTFTDYLPIEDPKMEENCGTDLQSAFFGSLQLMQLCFSHMVAQGGGSIINMGTGYSIRCEPGFLAYAATKEAIRVLTKTAAKEWGKHKIRVNTILPSALTPKSIWYLEDSGTYDLELAKVAMGRFGEPKDIAPTAIFLASDDADFVTGQTIGVEGGTTML